MINARVGARRSLAAAMIIAATVCAPAGAKTAASGARTATMRCHVELITLAPPTAASGIEYGSVNCNAPIGTGVQQDRFSIHAASASSASAAGAYRQYFATGTVAGAFHLTFHATAATIRYAGRAAITSGTGAYSGARGSETISCASTDGGTHSHCTTTIVLARP